MPLLKGNSPEIISQNIRELRKSGMKQNQAIAVAMKHARKGTGKTQSIPMSKEMKSVAKRVAKADPWKVR